MNHSFRFANRSRCSCLNIFHNYHRSSSRPPLRSSLLLPSSKRSLLSPAVVSEEPEEPMAPLTEQSRKAIERLRAYRHPEKGPWDELHHTRRAAVLLLLFADHKGELRVVLTERSSSLRTFAGQVALPGGKADDVHESPVTTSRREAEEEIGLPATPSTLPKPFTVEHLCELPMNLSRNNLGVVPCVAFLSGGNAEESLIPRLDPKEVASVFTAPFEAFLSGNYDSPEFPELSSGGGGGSIDEEGATGWYSGYWIEWHNGARWKMHEFHVPARPVVSRLSSRATYETPYPRRGGGVHDRKIVRYRVWGLTARILVDAARVAYDREPEFECVEYFGDDEMIRELHRRGLMEERKRRGSKSSGGEKQEEEESGRVKLLKEKAVGKL